MNTDWLDERIRLGEVPEGSRAKAESRANSPEGERAAAALAMEDGEILRRLPPARMAMRILDRRQERRAARSPRRDATWIPLAVAACALALAFLADPGRKDESAPSTIARGDAPAHRPSPTDSVQEVPAVPEVVAIAGTSSPDEGIRIRGDRGLAILVVAPDGTVDSAPGSVPAGATLRVVVPNLAQGAVFSLDETGAIQRHWPLAGDSSRPVPAGPLPRDWETDGSKGWDRFLLVSSPTAFDVARVEAHLRGAAASRDPAHRPVRLPEGMAVRSVLVDRTIP